MSNRVITALTVVTLLAGSVILSSSYLSDLIGNKSKQLALPEATAASLPFLVDVHTEPKLKVGDAEAGSSYLQINPHWMDNFGEMGCEECTMIEYKVGPKGFAGAAYQSEEPLNFKDAKKVRFFAMGEKGGEKVKFGVGGIDEEKAAKDTGQDKSKSKQQNPSSQVSPAAGNSNVFKNAKFRAITEEVTLKADWTRYEISVEGFDLSSVDYPFGFIISQSGGASKERIFLHSIVYEKQPASYNVLESSEIPFSVQNETLVVQLQANATNATSGSTISFNTNVSNGLEPYEYTYNFDDDQTEESDEANITHVFAEEGVYNVSAAVTDSENRTGSGFVEIEITPASQEQPLAAIEENATGQNETLDGQAPDENVTEAANETLNDVPEIIGNDSVSEQAEDIAEEPENQTSEENNNVEANETSTEEPDSIQEEADAASEEDLADQPQNETEDANSSPVAEAGSDLAAMPGSKVILDASESTDEDGDEITYSWDQVSGQDVEISGADTATPEITMPDENEDLEITLELKVSDGELEDDDTVSIFVQSPEELDGVKELELLPASADDSEWDVSEECEDESADCISDGSGGTFVFADEPDVTDLYSFEELDNDDLQIDRVTAKITAKNNGETGFVSIVVDDPDNSEHYSTLDISISSDSFEDYSYSWDSDPVTGDEWTPDLLSSIKAGFMYTAGQSGVEISEMVLVVSYHEDQPADVQEDSSDSNDTSEVDEAVTPEETEEEQEEITEPPISEQTADNETSSNSTSDET